MPPPPTRREQAQLDELLSDIYRGIETLPDRSHYQQAVLANGARSRQQQQEALLQSPRSYTSQVREYELPGSAPLVRQHKQELARLQAAGGKQPQRSTLKRNTNTPETPSLASFVTSSTPENRRRVRIVDPSEKGRNSDDDNHDQAKVKYVNTNKLIYHQEKNPDDDDDDDDGENNNIQAADDDQADDDDEDIDGVTRVEYYHTSWLDRQLGRASKRRSSKELNERQVKEKAMIEELKRSLKNGAITLRQSFRGKRKGHSKPSETYDDQVLDYNQDRHRHHHHHHKQSSVFGSGLATVPRNHSNKGSFFADAKSGHQGNSTNTNNNNSSGKQTPKQTSDNHLQRPASNTKFTSPVAAHQQPNYSRTLPHNYQQQQQQHSHQPHRPHQLLQSHYKGGNKTPAATPNYNTIGSSWSASQQQAANLSDTMRPPNHTNACDRNHQQQTSPPPPPLGNTISSIPSATEVVRSALSRSGSQVSLNQLNKTINLLPNSPPLYGPNSPAATPTQQLKAASPSLSPSPNRVGLGSPTTYQRQNSDLTSGGYCQSPKPNPQYSSKTMGASSQAVRGQDPQQQRLYGSRLVPSSPNANQQQQQRPVQAPVYANPHASLMQHRSQQMSSQTTPGRSSNSVREFNELDNLLRSLSPQHSSVQVTPGFTAKPAQPSFGFGYAPPAASQPQAPQPYRPMQQQQQHQQQQLSGTQSDIYSRVQKQQQPQFNRTHDPYVIDATDKKDGPDCQQRQELSEFEPKIELVPSMEDYQNISKLNPVKNHYWYKPNMSRDRAISLLKDKPQGTFIVRDSTSFRGAYGLAVKVAKLPKNVHRNPDADPSAELIRHFLIEPTPNGVKLKGYPDEPVFGSLPALIYQHSLTEIALPCKLLIPRTDIEDQQFNLKQKQFFDEFAASKEQAKHLPYQRTSPDGGYRRYPGDVYINNEHRIIFQ